MGVLFWTVWQQERRFLVWQEKEEVWPIEKEEKSANAMRERRKRGAGKLEFCELTRRGRNSYLRDGGHAFGLFSWWSFNFISIVDGCRHQRSQGCLSFGLVLSKKSCN